MGKFIIHIKGETKQVYPDFDNSEIVKQRDQDQQYLRAKWFELTFQNDDFRYLNNAPISNEFIIDYIEDLNGIERVVLKGKFTKADCTPDLDNQHITVTPITVDDYTSIEESLNVKRNIIGQVPATSGIKYDLEPILQIYSRGSNSITNIIGQTAWDSEVSLVFDGSSEAVEPQNFGFGNGVFQIFISGVENGVNPDVTGEYLDLYLNDQRNAYQKGNLQILSYGLGVDDFGDIVGNDIDNELGFISIQAPAASLVDILDFDSVWAFPLQGAGTYEARYIGKIEDDYFFKGDYSFGQVTPNIQPNAQITHVSGGSTTTPQGYISIRYETRQPNYRWCIRDSTTGDYLFIAEMNTPLNSLPYFQNGVVFNSLAGNGDQVKCLVNVIHARVLFRDLEEVTYNDGVSTNPLIGETIDMPENDILPFNENYNKIFPYDITADQLTPTDLHSTIDQGYGLFSEDALHFGSEYFVAPSTNHIPINKREWTEQSIWFEHNIRTLSLGDLNKTEVTLNHAYSIRGVVNQLVKLADENLSHDESDFFYGAANALRGVKRDVYIVPKTNILTVNYDRPASRAELSLKELFDALKAIYNVYYHSVDGKVITEHLSYYERGRRYVGQNIGIDLTAIPNPREGTTIRNRVWSYEKQNLPEYRNYAWMDDSSDYFNGSGIQVLDKYVTKGDIKENNVNVFTSDLAFVLSNPSNISKNGFVLLECIDKKVTYENNVQNGHLAFSYLLPNYHRHGMSGRNAVVNGQAMEALSITKTKKQEVYVPNQQFIDENRLIITELGTGQIKSISRTKEDFQTKIEVLHETES